MEYELNSTDTTDWIFSSIGISGEISSKETSFNFNSNTYSISTTADNTTESATFMTTASSPRETTTRYYPTYPTYETQPSEDVSDTILITIAALVTLALIMCCCYCGIKNNIVISIGLVLISII